MVHAVYLLVGLAIFLSGLFLASRDGWSRTEGTTVGGITAGFGVLFAAIPWVFP